MEKEGKGPRWRGEYIYKYVYMKRMRRRCAKVQCCCDIRDGCDACGRCRQGKDAVEERCRDKMNRNSTKEEPG